MADLDFISELVRYPRESLSTEVKAWFDPSPPEGQANSIGGKTIRGFLFLGLLLVGMSAMAQPANDDVQSGQLVFSASLGRNDRPFTLILLDLKTGSQQLLADYNSTFAVAPTWSPDGRYLLYSLNRDCDGIYLYDVQVGRNERIDQPAEHRGGCQAAWSPDGRSIAYMSARHTTAPDFYYDLYKFDLLLAAVVNTTVVADENLTVGSTVWLPAESVAPGR